MVRWWARHPRRWRKVVSLRHWKKEGGDEFDKMVLQYKKHPFPEQGPPRTEPLQRLLTNEECLDEARKFFEYADIERYRGSPHKL
ncbi:hypothetical protein CQ12_32400 [Bradyrhizobium jicamae]|uniref:Uncharacterized protein n=1 Tax=Bradyrhizobium jicamae TaxID=280332 RepID=A0A0R3M746_9BRAD|nr:hypothetical protein [Bradyrhizobium jicamae]KRR15848.1 hypothetical protein CQ12_32400 [Bradyrhizobium jicamae]